MDGCPMRMLMTGVATAIAVVRRRPGTAGHVIEARRVGIIHGTMERTMKRIMLSLVLLVLSKSLYGGPVVIDGTDANDIGHGSVTNGVNQQGWLYMQKVLDNLASQVDPSVVKVVVDIGT